MEAKELRIGNIIHSKEQSHNDKGEFTGWVNYEIIVDLEVLQNILTNNTDFKYSAIPLTEEWLIKFGFVKVRDYPVFRLDGLQIEFNGFDSQWGAGLLDEKTVLKYVHQLQNLFFALKGKELTLK